MSAAEVGTPNTVSIRDPAVRSRVYGTLARCFRYPDQGFVDELLADGNVLGVFWALHSLLEPHGATPLTDVGQWLSSRKRQTLLRQLSADYARLFIPGTRPVIAPPYESVYSEQGPPAGGNAGLVMAAYRESGLAPKLEHSDLPDHLSAELEFMQWLARAEHDAVRMGEQSGLLAWVQHQEEFLRNHLGWWVPLCMERVSSRAQTPFYRLLAGATERFVRWDLHRRIGEDGPATTWIKR